MKHSPIYFSARSSYIEHRPVRMEPLPANSRPDPSQSIERSPPHQPKPVNAAPPSQTCCRPECRVRVASRNHRASRAPPSHANHNTARPWHKLKTIRYALVGGGVGTIVVTASLGRVQAQPIWEMSEKVAS